MMFSNIAIRKNCDVDLFDRVEGVFQSSIQVFVVQNQRMCLENLRRIEKENKALRKKEDLVTNYVMWINLMKCVAIWKTEYTLISLAKVS